MMIEPPRPPLPEPPTPAEIERAYKALLKLWPSLLTMARRGHGELRVYYQDGKPAKWEAVQIDREYAGE